MFCTLALAHVNSDRVEVACQRSDPFDLSQNRHSLAQWKMSLKRDERFQREMDLKTA